MLRIPLLLAVLLINQLAFADLIRVKEALSQQKIQSIEVKAIVMLNVAKATNKAGDKIISCNKKTKLFKLNEEDMKYFRKYKVTFFWALSLLNMRNSDQCYNSELINLEREHKKTYKALRSLALFPKIQQTYKTYTDIEPLYRKVSEKDFFDQLTRIPLDLLFYLKRRTAHKLYNQPALFSSLDKYRLLSEL